MYEIFAEVLKYVFITIILMFISNIIRLIYTDIRLMQRRELIKRDFSAYLLLLTEDELDFLVEKKYGLSEKENIGRGKRCTIVIDDPFLSQLHCEISMIDAAFHIRDKKSTNGSKLNGKKIGEKWERLENEDVISIGQLEFKFVDYAEV